MPNDYVKKDPDLLLKDLSSQRNSNEKKGKLRVFLGMCPGVGKTYSMLKAAHSKKAESIDIVIGIVETHKRIETEELVNGLEKIPLKVIEHKGIQIYELDIDLILKRNPKIVLIDELAHHNAPNSRHPKRYQDVLEILDAGIDVYTTVNIQHIETRSDLVKQITNININETVPDSIIEMASQIELIDLQPEELLKRLKDGKVYLGERAERASEHFFKIEHLIALRELALRFTAEIVDTHLLSEMSQRGISGPWNTNERLLVAISHSPHSAQLIKTTRRMAFNLEAPWIALYIEKSESLSTEDQIQLNKNITLAKELGAEFLSIQESDIVGGIERIAKQRNVSQIILGRPGKKIFDYIGVKNIIDHLTERLPSTDIHIVRQNSQIKRSFNLLSYFKIHSPIQQYYNILLILLIVTFSNLVLRDFIGYRAVGFLYLFTVLVVSSFSNRGPIIFSAFLSALIWDFFFIPPYFTFHISDKEDIILCFTYIVVALFTGYLANQKRRQQLDLKNRELRSHILYKSSRSIIHAKNRQDIIKVTEEILAEIFKAEVYFFSPNNDSNLINNFAETNNSIFLSQSEYAVCQWSYHHTQKAGKGTETLSSAEILCLPMSKALRKYGVFSVKILNNKTINLSMENIVETIITLAASALENINLQEEAKQKKLLIESEKLHQSLLNSISHEMRIPLTSIHGNCEILQKKIPNELDNYVSEIKKSSFRLNRVIENLLDTSRLANGALELKKEIIDVEDFLIEIHNNYRDSLLTVSVNNINNSPSYVLGDSKFLEHAIFNILYNARQFSRNEEPIEVSIENKLSNICIKIRDHGPGIDPNMLHLIFDRFKRLENKTPGGIGLGLSIAKEVIEAHSGTIKAYNHHAKGAIFEVNLPSYYDNRIKNV